ncbi:MAG: hypothetical protein M1343_05915 [Chloroflexi bacterium]|nr:hypothetical protein [Chloroflexota bacterium]
MSETGQRAKEDVGSAVRRKFIDPSQSAEHALDGAFSFAVILHDLQVAVGFFALGSYEHR